jgi:hypothetical protein
MAKNSEVVFYDAKTEYICRTLSRTDRKNYENYVINAIWNRIDKKIRPVSQQYVNNPNDKRKHYFLDLYFPSVNLGIECNEAYHANNVENDNKRKVTIYDELNQLNIASKNTVNHQFDYKQIVIEVYSKSFDEVEAQIDSAVAEINKRAKDIDLSDDWAFMNPELYFKDKEYITSGDNIIFKTIVQAAKIIFNTSDVPPRRGGFVPKNPKFEKINGIDTSAWFPQLVIEEDGQLKPRAQGWSNILTNDGNTILEYHETKAETDKKYPIRITFTKSRDTLHNDGYKFVGIFECKRNYVENGKTVWVYEKIADEYKIIK